MIPAAKQNAIGALRLFLASLVIISHAPELLDGNRGREPLEVLFGTLTLGDLAVDGFFLISGALIAASWMSDPAAYFPKRIRRIYPGFIAASLICIFIVGPLAGGRLPATAVGWARAAMGIAALKAPAIDGAFASIPFHAVNGSMWSISYEFRCYILAALFGAAGLYRKPRLYLALTVTALAANLLFLIPSLGHADAASGGWFVAFFGRPSWSLRLISIFMAGSCFRLFRPNYRARTAALCGLALIPLLFVPVVAEIALAVFGGYLLFWVAYEVRSPALRAINAKDDISYGVYLYAFPITQLLVLYAPGVHLIGIDAISIALSYVAGWLSWKLVEQPSLSVRVPLKPAAARSI